MSVVIAARYKNGIAMIADRQATSGTTKTDNVNKIAYYKYSDSAIGVVGYLRDCNVMRMLDEIVPYKDILDRIKIDDLYVMKVIVPNIIEQLAQAKRIENKNGIYEMDSHMLYITSDKIFEIGGDFSVVEEDGYFGTIGCGSDKVIGYMTSVGDTSYFSKEMIEEVLYKAIAEGCDKDVFINSTCDIIFIDREEE